MSDITRHRTIAEWESKNPVLPSGVFGFEEETGKVKQGDGTKRWSQLSYLDVPPYTLPRQSDVSSSLDLDALKGAFRSLAIRPDPAAELIAARLDTGAGNIVLGVASDSTLNDSSDGLRVWLSTFGADHPDLRILYGLFNSGTGVQQDPLATLQAGTGTAPTGGRILTDTFTRTAASIIGTAADTGQVWTGAGAVWSVDGAKTICGGTGNALAPTGASGDMAVALTAGIDTTPAAGSKTFAMYSNWRNAQNNLWAQINISSGGVVTGTLWKRIGNTAAQIGTFGALGLTARALNTVPMTLSLSGLAVTATINGVTVTATILDADRAALGGSAGFGALAAATAGATVDGFTVDAPVVAGTTQTLTVYNAAVPGSRLSEHNSRVAAEFPTAPDVVLISSSHNHGTDSAASYLTEVDAYAAALLAVYPKALILAASENPQKTPATTVQQHLVRQVELRAHAARKGWGYLPVHEAYLSATGGGASLIQSDGIHPTTGAGSTGAQLWADTLNAHIAARSLVAS